MKLFMKKCISNILIILIIMFLLNIFYSKFILKDSLIKVFGKAFVIVTTGSMEPEIETGELVIVSEENKYYKGDIITYEDEENFLVTHRIFSINEKNFIAKGDANNVNDEEVSNGNIKGKVIYHSKILGNFVLYFLKPIVIAYITLFIGINLYFLVFNKSTNNKENQSNEIEVQDGKENQYNKIENQDGKEVQSSKIEMEEEKANEEI